MAELERILVGKLGFDADHYRQVHDLLTELATEVVPSPHGPPESVTGDPADDLLLACAVAAPVEILISGDRRHMLPVGTHRGVRIVTPQAVLAELSRG